MVTKWTVDQPAYVVYEGAGSFNSLDFKILFVLLSNSVWLLRQS